MIEPQEVSDRRWRFNLMAAVETIADSKNLIDLRNSELLDSFFDCVTDDCLPHGKGAMSAEEYAVVRELCEALTDICDRALANKRSRIGGKVVHGVDPEDLVALGWFQNVQPLARRAFDTFGVRGWRSEGLLATRA